MEGKPRLTVTRHFTRTDADVSGVALGVLCAGEQTGAGDALRPGRTRVTAGDLRWSAWCPEEADEAEGSHSTRVSHFDLPARAACSVAGELQQAPLLLHAAEAELTCMHCPSDVQQPTQVARHAEREEDREDESVFEHSAPTHLKRAQVAK